MKNGSGRPRKMEGLDLITLDEALARIQAFYKLPEPPYKKGTLKNKISRRELNRYGPRHITMVDWNEVQRKLCG